MKAVYNKCEICDRNLKEYGMRKLKEKNQETTSGLADVKSAFFF